MERRTDVKLTISRLERQDGGAAFPCEYQSFGGGLNEGMSLRDWFAGQALAGMLASPGNVDASVFARAAYNLADAMLRAREAPDA